MMVMVMVLCVCESLCSFVRVVLVPGGLSCFLFCEQPC